tara:strand:+ start:27435 stop:28760 length:1326 start_codon:yes stop_codon:yes gene_type:complete
MFYKNLLSKTLLLCSLILFSYVFYRSEIFWSGENRSYYFKYYVFISLLFFTSIVNFFLSKKLKTYFIIILMTSLVSAVLADLYLSYFGNHGIYFKKQKIKIFEENSNRKFDQRNTVSIYSDLVKQNKNITVKISPKQFLKKENLNFYPLAGISKKDTIYSNENGYYLIYKSDRFGFNNPDNEWNKKETEYLLIGDSFAHGCCVKNNENIGHNLRKLSNKSVINLGYSANGPLLELGSLKEYYPNKVNNIVWLYFENDLDDLNDELQNEFLKKYLLDKNFLQNLTQKQDEIDLYLSKSLNDKFESRKLVNKENKKLYFFIDTLKLYKLRHFFSSLISEKRPLNFKIFEEIIVEAKFFARKKNANLIFVYLPDYSTYKIKKTSQNYEKIKNLIKKNQIKFIDMHKEFSKNENPLVFFPFGFYGHYNAKGYEKVAQKIFSITNN